MLNELRHRKKAKKVAFIVIPSALLLSMMIIAFYSKNNKITQQNISMPATINQAEVINSTGLKENATDAVSMKENTKYLQDLIDQTSYTGGGTIHIPAGTYYFTPNWDREDGAKYTWIGDGKDRAYFIIECKDNVTIEGTLDENGNKATILKPYGKDMELSINMFHYISDDFVYLDNADFKNFIIDSSDTWKKSSATYLAHGKGFMIAPYQKCDWDNVEVRNTDGTGFGMDFPIDSTIKNCLAVGCGKAATENDIGASGFGIGIGYSTKESILIENCTAIGNRKFGFFFEHQGLFRNDIKAKTANGFTVENCIARGNKYNFGGERANDVTFSNCTSYLTGNENNIRGFYFGNNSRRIFREGCKVDSVFSDVKDDSKEYYKPIYWALNNAMIDGGADKTTFSPDEPCARAQAVLLLWRRAGRYGNVVLNGENVKSQLFDDVAENDWYTDAVVWAENEKLGILPANEKRTFRPSDACNREEFLVMLWKWHRFKYSYY